MQMSWVLILEPCWPPVLNAAATVSPDEAGEEPPTWAASLQSIPPQSTQSTPVHSSRFILCHYVHLHFILFQTSPNLSFPPLPSQTSSILFRRIRPTHTVTKPCLHSKTTPPTQPSKTSSQTRCCVRKKMTKRAVDTISNNWAQLPYSHSPDALRQYYSQRTQILNCQWLVLLFKVSDSSG